MRAYREIGLLTAFGFALIGLVIYADYQDKKQWEGFSKEHACKIVAISNGSYATGVTTGGKAATVFNPGSKSFLCDDGITYTRQD